MVFINSGSLSSMTDYKQFSFNLLTVAGNERSLLQPGLNEAETCKQTLIILDKSFE